jgi:catechol 2,3-dioxygenase-like lactoylglutathione lyase family enzyme
MKINLSSVFVDDQDRALDFCTRVLGLREEVKRPGFGGGSINCPGYATGPSPSDRFWEACTTSMAGPDELGSPLQPQSGVHPLPS